nr:MAG TPA: hypothetical protein [Caudoviricetes sp.]
MPNFSLPFKLKRSRIVLTMPLLVKSHLFCKTFIYSPFIHDK